MGQSICEHGNAGCEGEPPSVPCECPPRLDTSTHIVHTWSPPCALRHTCSLSGLCQRQTSWVAPIQKGPLLTDAYQLRLPGPLHQRPPAFLPPIKALGGLWLQGLLWLGLLRAGDPSTLSAPSFRPALCRGPCSSLTGKLRHTTPRLGCEDKHGAGGPERALPT